MDLEEDYFYLFCLKRSILCRSDVWYHKYVIILELGTNTMDKTNRQGTENTRLFKYTYIILLVLKCNMKIENSGFRGGLFLLVLLEKEYPL